ncbi:hypothetical protein C9422_02395 [Pseudomonas sp. B1(2018)]|nr:hypothetical protein C9422_02395 [Pseudomonas sp. B1(2018)]
MDTDPVYTRDQMWERACSRIECAALAQARPDNHQRGCIQCPKNSTTSSSVPARPVTPWRPV